MWSGGGWLRRRTRGSCYLSNARLQLWSLWERSRRGGGSSCIGSLLRLPLPTSTSSPLSLLLFTLHRGGVLDLTVGVDVLRVRVGKVPLETLLLLVLLAAVLPGALQHCVRVHDGPRLPFHGRRWRWGRLLLLLLLLRFSLLSLLLIRAGISLPLLRLLQVVRPALPLAGVLGRARRSREVELVLLGRAAGSLASFALPLRL